MPKKQINLKQASAIVIAALLLIFLGFWFWYTNVYLKPSNVFWSTMNQNLQTGSITETENESASGQTMTQISDILYKGSLIAHTTVTLNDKTTSGTSTIITETYGTPGQDYLRYPKITSTDNSVPKGVVGMWATSIKSKGQPIEILSDALTATPLMFGYLSTSARADIINQLHDHNVFNLNFGSTITNAKYDGHRVYAYDVTLNLQNYIQVFRSYLDYMGQSTLALSIPQPSTSATYKMTLYINPVSRQIMKMVPDGSSVQEIFTNQDVNTNIKLPGSVKLTINQLRNRLTQ